MLLLWVLPAVHAPRCPPDLITSSPGTEGLLLGAARLRSLGGSEQGVAGALAQSGQGAAGALAQHGTGRAWPQRSPHSTSLTVLSTAHGLKLMMIFRANDQPRAAGGRWNMGGFGAMATAFHRCAVLAALPAWPLPGEGSCSPCSVSSAWSRSWDRVLLPQPHSLGRWSARAAVWDARGWQWVLR